MDKNVASKYAARKALGWPVKRVLTDEEYARYRQAILTLGAWAVGVGRFHDTLILRSFRFSLLDRQQQPSYSHAIVAAAVTLSALWLEVASHPTSWVASW